MLALRGPLRFLVSSILVALVYLVDPFYIVSGSSRVSEEIVQRVLSFFYRNDAQSKVALVLVDDKDAEDVNGPAGWPLPLDMQGDILRGLLCANPAGVFVDVNFRAERKPGEAALLADALRFRRGPEGCAQIADGAALAQAAPVLLAHVPSRSSACQPLATTGDACALRDAFSSVRASAIPVAMPGTSDFSRYVLVGPESSNDIPGSSSPALELYLRICAARPDFAPGCRDREQLARLKDPDGNTSARIATVRWGFFVSEPPGLETKNALIGACPEAQHAGTNTLRALLDQFVADLAPRAVDVFGSGVRLGKSGWCPYHLTFTRETAFSGNAAKLLEDRVVVYGAATTAGNDIAYSPVLGVLPAAHVHAMMLDNLLQNGADYWRDPPTLLHEGVEVFVAIVIIAFGVWRSPRILSSQNPAMRSCLFYAGSIAFVFLVAAFLMCVFKWSPINWTGLLAIAFIEGPGLFRDPTKCVDGVASGTRKTESHSL